MNTHLDYNPQTGIYTGLWACARPFKHWTGAWPEGIIERLHILVGKPDKKDILEPFGGISNYGITIDLNRDLKPTIIADAQNLPFRDSSFNHVYLDPPYNEKYIKHYSKINKHLPNTKIKFSVYKALSEAMRVSYNIVAFLHFLVPKNMDNKNYKVKAVIGITTGPNKQIRCLTIYKRKTEKRLTEFLGGN